MQALQRSAKTLQTTSQRVREVAVVPSAPRATAAVSGRAAAPLVQTVSAPLASGRRVEARAASTAPAPQSSKGNAPMAVAEIGLIGLAVMGQNMALNVADKGFPISVYNRSYDKTEAAVKRAQKEGLGDKLHGYEHIKDFVASLQRPRRVIILVKAGAPVDQTIDQLCEFMEPGDIIIDGGNEWYENTEKRMAKVGAKGILYMGMGVSGGEEGARRGPSLMPGGSPEAYSHIKSVVEKVAAQVDDGPCVMYIGGGGAGNFVKMVHNGIEYGDMQLISEAYDVLKTLGGLNNEELAAVFKEWNDAELKSFLVEITSIIMNKKDDQGPGYLVDKIVDQTGSKGTGKWTVQQAAELAVAAPTMASALDARYMSALKSERVAASKVFSTCVTPGPVAGVDKAQLIKDVRAALYASKICSYAQGMNIIKAKSIEKKWNVDLGGLARIWKGGCIIRAQFLDRIRVAYERNPELPSLLVDPDFAKELTAAEASWRRVAALSITHGVPIPSMTSSLGYFDTYRRDRLPANLVQAQRDFFGSHTYQRFDKEGWYHTVWDETFGSADSITTSGYVV
ncbi:hypothetical protein HYH02_001717 [Chlamydomonas schloesseri]|uniref:6-phosphogluconate dehydrogenase, decarboxylating n=1 Tax=Chlamydomonas schloesseri TaxID=2026947 RepID=A0A835WU54_9CHLO|nr:hypothetical protein HYH02_001717 [Chlamydomonas schloesseri]|eukprot:KAG2453497.1 hypothetical protein HYH02_001717 [Chlamydomonas schloesseri]